MKRILTILLVVSILMGTALPITALASDEPTIPATGEVTENTSDEMPAIMPLASGFEGSDSEFYTRIRLTVTDRSGSPIEGAVYGLYRQDNDQLVETLTTDSYGVATSDDVPVNVDYYLEEQSTPTGYLTNDERHYINLEDICAPSRIDVTAVYDPIMGRIKVIKVDEDGNTIPGVGFYVYRTATGSHVDTIYTDSYGEATTTDLPYGEYELYEFEAPEGFVTGNYYTITIENHEETVETTITNYRASGSLRIHKTGNDEKSLHGAVFSVHSADDNAWVCDITTNASGYAYAYSLPLGRYHAIEKSGVEGYVADTETRHPFTLSNHDEWATLDITNKCAGEDGRLRLLKTDDKANPLSDVVFGLYRAWDNKKLAELTTGEDGIAEYSPLIPQFYYLKELVGKDGYTMVTGIIPFTVDGSGETVELTVENSKSRVFGKVRVIKTDDTGAPIEGVRFGVYCRMGNLLEELVTDEDGVATSGILNGGEGYYLAELEAAAGFVPDGEQHPFAITENEVIVEIEVVNPRITGGLQVIKTDEEGKPLAGATFGIYQDGFLLEELTTGVDGFAESGILYYGDYELIELSTVNGYELVDTPIPFSITEQDVVIEIPVTNTWILGTVVITKTDEDSRPLAGAVFGLYNKQGQKLAELTTAEDGTASYTLPKGEYSLKELAAPEGFVIEDELIPFTIETNGQVVEKTVVNTAGFGILKVIKTGEETDGGENVPLAGVAFDVYHTATSELVDNLVTDEAGEVTIDLPLGRYHLVETATVEGYQLLAGTMSFALTENGAALELPIMNQQIPNPENGGIRLTKVCAETGGLLPGSVFWVYELDSDVLAGELATGTDGTASVSLPAGDYYLVEQTAPAGYVLSNEKIPVTVVEAQYTNVTVENQPEEVVPGELVVIKNAKNTGERLPDAVFSVYVASTDELVVELTTGKDGIATASLAEGDYYLEELTPPQGFQPLADSISFHIATDTTLKLNIANSPVEDEDASGLVRFLKTDRDTGDKLAGAVIGIYHAGSGVKVAELTTDEQGVAEYALAEGDYNWKELRAPEGYILLEESHSFTVEADSTREISVENEALPEDTGTLVLIKKAAGSGEKIPDAVFGIYTADGNRKVTEITTDDGGEARIQLEPGRYYLKELSVPSPFVPETAHIPFFIKEVGAVVTIEASNTKGMGAVLLEKKDEEGAAVPGAVFTLYRPDGTQIAELTSGRDGTASYELPVGAGYYLVEKTAAVGYRLDTARHGFDILHGEESVVEVVNEALTGTVKIYFKHVSDGRELTESKTLTDRVGIDYIKWMRENKYENMPITGYTLLRTDYPSSLSLVDGKLVVTLWYDSPTAASPAAPSSATPSGDISDTPNSGVQIPRTGGSFPVLDFALAALCWIAASVCAVMLVKGRKQPALAAAGDAPACKAVPEPAPSSARKNSGTNTRCKKKRKKRKR